jgi:predicted SAM-dependent methyltransferase
MKIDIGAGTKPLPGYIHVDTADLGLEDIVVDDGRTLATFADGVAEEIYSHWFLEHVARHEVHPMLERWMRVLTPGGRLRLITNNHEAHNRCLAEGHISWQEWSYLIYAVETKGGYSIWDVHKCAWNQESLRQTLERAGFVEVQVQAQWGCREADGRLKCPALIAEGIKPSGAPA